MDTLGLYIHVPFCGKKCRYCAFYSDCYSPVLAEEYVNAVIRNIRHYSHKNQVVDTLYFGGGTPSLLSSSQLDRIITETKNGFALEENAEITLEANPNTLNPQKLCELRKIGINRLSLGVQSMNDHELAFLGRSHTAERAVKAVNDAFDAGFENISCDLMLGIPKQTAESLEYSINRLAELPIQHISAYILKVEENTAFDCEEIRNALPDEDTSADMYLKMCSLLESKEFKQYEVSNFAKQGFESRHNSRYWKCLDYLGIGPSAHSCYGGKRFAVPSHISDFVQSEVQSTVVTDESPCGFEERAMLALRLKEGLDLDCIDSHREDIERKIPHLIKAGYAQFDGRFLSLTAKGFLMSNSVIEYVIF
ncbi:MAG: radical SAM family heme chaperone HemW [Ruminococcus sp.]|nr:radical SAM family heme chaperone HemW [Ruminococcus sp.]